MYNHPGVLDAISKIESWGGTFIDPRIEENKAKLPTENTITRELARRTTPSPLDGHHVVVTSGATVEPIDPVRILTNRSSGKTGRAVAQACYVRGADVTLIHNGPTVPYGTVESVETADAMLDRTLSAMDTADALISTAAISDYTVDYSEEKIRSKQDITLELHPTPKLIDTVRDLYPEQPIVGFKTETTTTDDDLVQEARRILDRVNLEFVVSNNANVMGQDETRVLLVDSTETIEFSGSKQELGFRIADKLATTLTH
jgi:phosphopantothenoylcysteine decarboxylase/phosphopantothenate--cysteine ligase